MAGAESKVAGAEPKLAGAEPKWHTRQRQAANQTHNTRAHITCREQTSDRADKTTQTGAERTTHTDTDTYMLMPMLPMLMLRPHAKDTC